MDNGELEELVNDGFEELENHLAELDENDLESANLEGGENCHLFVTPRFSRH